MACIDLGNDKRVCPGDTVYTNYFDKGARVKAINPRTLQIMLESTYTGNTRASSPRELYLTRGCEARGMCVGDLVYTQFFDRGARIKAINPTTRQILLESTHTGNSNAVAPREILVTRGCIQGICVGDGIYTNFFDRGATVKAISQTAKKVLVQSTYTGNARIVEVDEIMVTDHCLDFEGERGGR